MGQCQGMIGDSLRVLYINELIFKLNGIDWRPRRSVVFCGWGAEEYAMIGSYEWAEENAKILSQRAVAYLNVDYAVIGKLFLPTKPLSLNLYNLTT